MDGFKEVLLSDLSDITVKHFISEHAQFTTPEFLMVKYTGTYLSGSAGKNDALFIVSTAKAAHEAWFTKAIILDFSELDYQWGDEMAWIYHLGWDRVLRFNYPVVILVGDQCRESMQSLSPKDFEDRCADSLVEAKQMAREHIKAYKQHLKDFHAK